MMRMNKIRGVFAAGTLALALSACGDLLTVTDPQRYTGSDLDNALPAVANGVEGALHEVIDTYVIYQSLMSDIYQHTGTWSGYDEVDHGRFQYGTSPMDGVHTSLLRARWFSGDAEERFIRVLEGSAANDPMMAQVQFSSAMLDLYIGMAFCESPAVPSGPAVTSQQLLQQSIEKFTRAMATAQAAGTPHYALAALAGRARANLLTGNYSAATSDAAAVPDGFSYDAIFNIQSNNSIVQLTTKGFNEAGGLFYTLWDRIDQSDDPGFIRDPWTNEPDRRMAVYFDGEVATDNETPHYSQWKYNNLTDDIPMVHADGMRLIQAEVLMNAGNDADALAIINTLRDNVGLTALAPPTGGVTMMDYLLSERMAEMFMEGIRAIDLHRFGLMDDVFLPLNDNERPGTGRPTQFSMTDTEAVYNSSINDDLAQRCLPKS